MVKPKLPSTERVVSYIVPLAGHFIIPSEGRTWHLSTTLNPAMPQRLLAEYVSPDGGFHALSLKDHFAFFQAMYDLRSKGGDIERARQFVADSMKNRYKLTLTRARHVPQGSDLIIHNYKTSSEERLEANLVGKYGQVIDVLPLETSLALTGKTPEEIEEILKYFSDRQALLLGFGSKPYQMYDSVFTLVNHTKMGNILGCNTDPSVDYFDSLGVR